MSNLGMANEEDRFMCPISLQLMRDPVIAADGHTYDRESIERWFQMHITSPVSGLQLTSTTIFPNHSLRSEIMEKFGLDGPTQSSAPPAPTTEINEIGEFTCSAQISGNNTVVTITPPSSSLNRVPTNVCIVMDVSGSMDAEADLEESSSGLTVLDLCKHACKTIISTLSEGDTFSFVIFHDDAETILTRVPIVSNSLADLGPTICEIEAGGTTNLWDGLTSGISTFEEVPGQNNHLILLTDGIPNRSPMRGEVDEFKRLLTSKGSNCCTHMCGFGYNLKSDMLLSLARLGGGSYAFIPDCSMLGSVFVNLLASALSTCATHVSLTISTTETVQPKPFVSEELKESMAMRATDKGLEVKASIDVLLYATPYSIVLPFSVSAGKRLHTNLKMRHWSRGDVSLDFSVNAQELASYDPDAGAAQAHVKRIQFVDEIFTGVREAKSRGQKVEGLKMPTRIAELAEEVSGISGKLAVALAQDLKGQAMEATSRDDWYERWGCHYLPSLAVAHWHQRCNNFKDGVMVYSTRMFDELVTVGGDKFQAIQLESYSTRPQPGVTSISSTGGVISSASAATYYNPAGVCFHGSCQLRMADGTLKNASEVSQDDLLYSKSGDSPSVKCVVVSSSEEFSQVGSSSLVTPFHPISTPTGWAFACDVQVRRTRGSAEPVYNFVLSHGHTIEMVGTDGDTVVAATLGHGFTGPVIQHPFFGTNAVVDALQERDSQGFADGRTVVGSVVRDPFSKIIVGFA